MLAKRLAIFKSSDTKVRAGCEPEHRMSARESLIAVTLS